MYKEITVHQLRISPFTTLFPLAANGPLNKFIIALSVVGRHETAAGYSDNLPSRDARRSSET